jgi:hypothetical protein
LNLPYGHIAVAVYVLQNALPRPKATILISTL